MAYTPINWQTGDTITADKLNRCDNGWGVESTQLFSETVTTVENYGSIIGYLEYSQVITADTIMVTFDGTEYECPSIDTGLYGAPWSDGLNGYDFSEFPFSLYTADGIEAELTTQTAGEHTVAVSTQTLQTSADFDTAVKTAADLSMLPFRCVEGVTTSSEIEQAISNGRLLYFNYQGFYYICTSYDRGAFTYIKDEYASSVTAKVAGGVFTVTAS